MQENPHSVPIFQEVAPKYEFLNSLMTLGRDKTWREACLSHAAKALGKSPETILDLATGTGDIARMCANKWSSAKVIGSDPTPAMLEIAKQSKEKIEWLQGVAENIKLESSSVDLATIAFGFRNVDVNLRSQCLNEVFRTLRPGGVFAILELGLPQTAVTKSAYSFLLKNCMPQMAGLFAPKEPYVYLANSILQFPTPAEIKSSMDKAGFIAFAPKALTGGMCWLYLGKKPY